jgi:hypothetical protein
VVRYSESQSHPRTAEHGVSILTGGNRALLITTDDHILTVRDSTVGAHGRNSSSSKKSRCKSKAVVIKRY